MCFGQTGQVKSEGQPIPGATVRATQGDRILSTLTDETGSFRFDGMTLGAWTVEVDMFGFDHARKEAQIAAAPSRIDFTLQLRDRTRQAARGAQPSEDALESANAASALINAEAPSIPQAGAEAANDSMLVNGSVSTGVQTSAADNLGGRGGFGPGGPGGPGGGPGGGLGGGGRGDGGGGGFGGGGGGGGFGGRGGGGGGGPRAGGRGPRNGNPAFIGNRRNNNNRITGSAYYQIGNSAVDARPFAVNGIPEPKAAFAQNRFGFSAGGPLFIPKLFNWSKVFWFVNYQGYLSKAGVDQAFNEPTPLQRTGNFSQTNSIIYDPTNNAPFAGNVIPTGRLSPIALG